MKRLVTVLCFFIFLFALPAMADGPATAGTLGPAGVHVRGGVNAYGNFQLLLDLKQAPASAYTILAAKVYANPSHTLLFALVDDSAPASVLESIQAEKPRGMTVGAVGASAPSVGIAAPPLTDTLVTVEYVVLRDTQVEPFTAMNASVSSILSFDLASQPDVGGGIKHCVWCGSTFCGCIYCSTPNFTACCPLCNLVCGIIECP